MEWDEQKIISKALSLEKELDRRIVKRDNATLFFLAKKHFGSWNNLMKAIGHEVRGFREAKIPLKHSKELFYFIGLLCSDGHIQVLKKKGNYKVLLFTSYEEEKEMILKLMKDLFDYSASVRVKDYGFSERVNYEIYIYSKSLCNFFINLGIPSGNKSSKIILPNLLMGASKKKILHFIRGIFDGDGSIIASNNQTLFRIYSQSKGLIFGLEGLLKEMDFSPRTNKYKEMWSLNLNKKGEVKRLFKLLYQDSGIYFYPRKKLKWSQQYI